MFAVDHAATALLVKRRYPSVPMLPLLLSVQAMELAWVALNLLGIERTTTESTVSTVADIHLAAMPYSHSVLTATSAAVAAWLILEKGYDRALMGRAVALGILSHLILDLATYAADIALWPGAALKLGLGLYDELPLAGFVLELGYGVLCWYVFRGSRALLALVIIGNLANLSFFTAAFAGPERFLAARPTLVVGAVAAQIVVTLALTYWLTAGRRMPRN